VLVLDVIVVESTELIYSTDLYGGGKVLILLNPGVDENST
jgi:hypothetical protein